MKVKNINKNGAELTDKLKVVSELNLVVIDKLDKLNEKTKTATLLEEQSKVLINYEKKITDQFVKTMNRDRWNKFFYILRMLIILSTFLFFGILVVFILESSGIIDLENSIDDLMKGIVGSLISLLSIVFLSILGYLGLKKETTEAIKEI